MFFSSHLCVGLLFLGLYSLPSPPSPPELLLSLSTSPKLSHTTHRTHPTQLLSSHKSQNSSHTTHLSQLILHNSTHSRAFFRVPFGGAAFVFSHWSSPKFFHRTHLTTHTTHLTQLHSSHNSQNSSHTTPLILQLTQLLSSHKSQNSPHTTHLSQLILHNSTHSRAAFVCHLVELLSCSLTEVHPSSFTQLISQLTQLISHNSTHLTTHRTRLTPLQQERWWGCCACVCIGTWTLSSPHPTPPHPTPPPWLVPSLNVRGWPLFVRGWRGFSVRRWLVCNVRRWLAFNVRRWRVDHVLVNGPCLPVYFYHNLFFEPPIACLAHGLQHICYLWITQSLPMQT